MATIVFEDVAINTSLLMQELAQALPARTVSLAVREGVVSVRVDDDATDADINSIYAIVEAHDPAELTALQAAEAIATTAPDRARNVPGWAAWGEQQAIDYIDANVTDLASAKTVLVGMARLLVALRDAQWPTLSVE